MCFSTIYAFTWSMGKMLLAFVAMCFLTSLSLALMDVLRRRCSSLISVAIPRLKEKMARTMIALLNSIVAVVENVPLSRGSLLQIMIYLQIRISRALER
jgi:hypothetical protein